ncbi:MAG: helix-turn-helix transcriptional regulator [Nitrospirales bacterium]|nr:helix-turn-helix domain-containing protein [Nitrospirales bacterium]
MVTKHQDTQQKSHLAALIMDVRKERGLTQLELSKALGYKNNAVSVCRWELGNTPIPPSQYMKIASTLNIPLKSLLQAAIADDPENEEKFSRLLKRLSLKQVPRDPNTDVDLRPDLRIKLKNLQTQYSSASLQALHDSAIEFYAMMADKFGLDKLFRPKTTLDKRKPKSPSTS